MSRKIKYQHTDGAGVVHNYVVRVKTNATAEDIENAVRKDLRLRLTPPRKQKDPPAPPAAPRPLSPAARATFAAALLLSIPPGKGG